jgi:hypothetical protein
MYKPGKGGFPGAAGTGGGISQKRSAGISVDNDAYRD